MTYNIIFFSYSLRNQSCQAPSLTTCTHKLTVRVLWSEGPPVRRPTGPKARRSEGPPVRRPAGPKASWSEGSLAQSPLDRITAIHELHIRPFFTFLNWRFPFCWIVYWSPIYYERMKTNMVLCLTI